MASKNLEDYEKLGERRVASLTLVEHRDRTRQDQSDATPFHRAGRIGEGTYGVVYRARDKQTGEVVALKKVRMDKERDGMPVTALREVRILQSSRHKNIVNLLRVVNGKKPNAIFLVFEYCEHDLARLLETMRVPFTEAESKCLCLQLLQAVEYLHRRWVFHRDLKLSNLLLNNRGELKLCDFGLARFYQPGNDGSYTPKVVTLWYRAPELLFGCARYTAAVDNWAVGCILAELLKHEPLFPGKQEQQTLDMMYKLLGTPNEKIWPGFDKLPKFGSYRMSPNQPYNYLQTEFNRLSTAGVDLLNRLLTYDPRRRCTAAQALEHGYFQEHPRPKRVEEMPTFPSLHDVLAPVSGSGDVSGRLTGHVDGAPAAGGVGGGSSAWDRPDAPLPRGGLKRKRPGGFGQPDRYGSVF